MSSNILNSPEPEVNIPLISISKLLLNQMKHFGNKIYLIEYNVKRSFTFNQMTEDCLRISNAWLGLGLKPGQTFGISGENSYEYMVCMLSGIFIGARAVPMRGSDTIDELKRTIRDREIKFLSLSWNKFNQIRESKDIFHNTKGIVFGEYNHSEEVEANFEKYDKLIAKTEPLSEDQIYEPIDVKEDICLVLESSGTTGLPKGCLFSHYNLVALVTIGSIPDGYNRKDNDIVSGHGLPAHISGVNQLIMSINNGSQLILHPKFEFETFCAAIEQYKITALSAPASLCLELLKNGTKYDISSLRKVISGGAPLPKGLAKQFADKYPQIEDFRQGYGMSEMTILIAFGEYGRKNYDSVGTPTPGNRIKIIDCITGDILGANQTGEICVTGPTLFRGYHNNIIATKETIDCDNYLHTGDLGYYDSNGNIYIVDRIKLLLKCDGMQISPIELETIFLTHFSVKDVAVVGKPDLISGQLPTAFVVIKEQYKDSIDCQELLAFVNSRITHQKRIREGIHIIDKIPKNKSGKTDRNILLKYLKHK